MRLWHGGNELSVQWLVSISLIPSDTKICDWGDGACQKRGSRDSLSLDRTVVAE